MHKSCDANSFTKYLIAVCIAIVCSVSCLCVGCVRDHESGVYAVYQATNTDIDDFDSKMDNMRSYLKELLWSKGYTTANVIREGDDRIRVKIPNIEEAGLIFEILCEPVQIAFVIDETGETVLTGEDVVNASSYYSANDGGYVVSLELTSEGQDKFYEATSNNIGKTMSIILTMGEYPTTISSPTINAAISGNAIISGNFTAESSEKLAKQIMRGRINVQLEMIESAIYST